MNVELLRQIQERIKSEPRQFQMHWWFSSFLAGNESDKIPNCGTAACIAGWACSIALNLNPLQANKFINVGNSSAESEYQIARRHLDLKESEAIRLFNFNKWPAQFQANQVEGSKEYGEQACRRIDHFIATDGRE